MFAAHKKEAEIMRQKLSKTRLRVLNFIIDYQEQHEGIFPSVREIGAGCDLKSPSTVHAHIHRLIQDGFIKELDSNTEGRKHRMFSVVSLPGISGFQKISTIPIIGKVAAGYPLLAFEDVEDYLPYDTKGKSTFFALRVKGDSMTDAAILDGDIVVVEKEIEPRNKQIVIALIGEEATCKEFCRKDDGHVWLLPHNENYQPIDGNECTILGVVRSVIRDLPK